MSGTLAMRWICGIAASVTLVACRASCPSIPEEINQNNLAIDLDQDPAVVTWSGGPAGGLEIGRPLPESDYYTSESVYSVTRTENVIESPLALGDDVGGEFYDGGLPLVVGEDYFIHLNFWDESGRLCTTDALEFEL